MQGIRVWSLVWEDSTSLKAPRACALQQEKQREATTTKSSLHSPRLEKALEQQQRPSTAKNNEKKTVCRFINLSCSKHYVFQIFPAGITQWFPRRMSQCWRSSETTTNSRPSHLSLSQPSYSTSSIFSMHCLHPAYLPWEILEKHSDSTRCCLTMNCSLVYLLGLEA